MISFYEQILSSHPIYLAENSCSYETFTERHLQALWFEQKYFKGLQTLDGKAIEILSPGIWNSEAGPDFLKAHLWIGESEFRGDIELHLSEEGWTQHGHQRDARYNDVILHIALWPSTCSRTLTKQNGEPVFQCLLEPCLTIPISRIYKLLDLDLYPYKKFLGSGRCAQTLFCHLLPSEIEGFFKGGARWRLLKKKEYLSLRVKNSQELLYAGFAMALGYKRNAEAFFELYLWLKQYRDLPIQEMMALALGSSGFFEKHFQILWEESQYYILLKTFWEAVKWEADHQTHLILHQVRPYNHPVRRLAYMVHMLANNNLEMLLPSIELLWEMSWKGCTTLKGCKNVYESIIDLIPDYADPYWNAHYTFEVEPQSIYLPLIGGPLKHEILVNVLLPQIYSSLLDRGNGEELQIFDKFFHALSASVNSKTRYLIHRFFGETPKGLCLSKADCEQGAFQLHRDFCQHYEASCVGCPFVDRYKSLKNMR